MPNRLAGETSPYLRQHAENPVDWYPWGEQALTRARTENRPILLSIGYAACHWCHVMAHESFADPATAAVMNEHFVSIKVDREERPDLDAIYMQAVQAMTGHGGWPMTVFLTPAGEPFYGGTYYPPEDRHGMPSFQRVLRAVADSYATRPDSVTASVASVRRIYDVIAPPPAPGALNETALDEACDAVAANYDAEFGGFGGAPKFPPTMLLDFLLRHWARTGDARALEIAHRTFRAMARGGIYDQIGGGFARYSVDREWLVPHFEKMLYDNALLIRFGSHLFEATKDPEVRRVTEETATWLMREMTSPEGGFYSSLDADSEGVEGKFYVWHTGEIDSLLGSDARLTRLYYGVTAAGNFEGHNILHVASDAEAADLPSVIARAKQTLYDARARRVWPALDDKILASWNGLMLRAAVDAARALGSDALAALALRNATFLAEHLVRDGRVLRTYKDGVAKIPGFLEDQAAVALGFLAMFEQSLDARWLGRARELADGMVAAFWDDETGVFFDTARDAERLVSRPRDPTDNAIPSGTSLAAELLLRLANYVGDDGYRTRGWRVLNDLATVVARHPAAFGHLLGDAEYALTFACHGDYCDMPSPRALEIARRMPDTPSPVT